MSELVCPAGHRYRVTSRHGEKLFVIDEADGFKFLLQLSRDRLVRGWHLEGDGPKRDRQIQRDRSQRRARRKVSR